MRRQRNRKRPCEDAIHHAALQGDREEILALLNAGSFVDATDDRNATPLEYAVHGCHVDCVELLLRRGADACKQTDGHTVAHYAAARGNDEILLAVLDAGCPLDVGSSLTGMTPLMYAVLDCHAECVQLLLDRGADAYKVSCDGCTAVHHAILGGHTETLRPLLAGAIECVELDILFALPFGPLPDQCVSTLSFSFACGCHFKATPAKMNDQDKVLHFALACLPHVL